MKKEVDFVDVIIVIIGIPFFTAVALHLLYVSLYATACMGEAILELLHIH